MKLSKLFFLAFAGILIAQTNIWANWSNVTDRIRFLMINDGAQPFPINPGAMQVDPEPGIGKRLILVHVNSGPEKKSILSIVEDGSIMYPTNAKSIIKAEYGTGDSKNPWIDVSDRLKFLMTNLGADPIKISAGAFEMEKKNYPFAPGPLKITYKDAGAKELKPGTTIFPATNMVYAFYGAVGRTQKIYNYAMSDIKNLRFFDYSAYERLTCLSNPFIALNSNVTLACNKNDVLAYGMFNWSTNNDSMGFQFVPGQEDIFITHVGIIRATIYAYFAARFPVDKEKEIESTVARKEAEAAAAAAANAACCALKEQGANCDENSDCRSNNCNLWRGSCDGAYTCTCR